MNTTRSVAIPVEDLTVTHIGSPSCSYISQISPTSRPCWSVIFFSGRLPTSSIGLAGDVIGLLHSDRLRRWATPPEHFQSPPRSLSVQHWKVRLGFEKSVRQLTGLDAQFL